MTVRQSATTALRYCAGCENRRKIGQRDLQKSNIARFGREPASDGKNTKLGSAQPRNAANIARLGLSPGVRCTRNMDLKAKKETLRLLSNGVYVLTSRNGDEYGVATITWVSQVSFQPPLVMAALRKEGNVFRCLGASGVAVLHVVGSDQKDLAQKFFSTTKESNGLLNGEPFTEGKTFAPVLKNLGAYLECKLVDICEDYGDHAIVILEVVEAGNSGTMEPLIVSNSP